MKRIPIFATLLVLLAIGTMIALGIWQLQRKAQKEALLAQYEQAEGLPPIAYPTVPVKGELPLFRHSTVRCINVVKWDSISGVSVSGDAGWAHVASCQTGGGEGPGARIAIGWSNRADNPDWNGGTVNGIIAPDNVQLIKLVAIDPVPGLQLLAKPSRDSIPNNHLIYTVQWFFFAAAAALIYALALRKRLKEKDGP